MAETEIKANASVREYITFRIGAQYYCIDIMSVREIRGWTPATVLPRAPGFVRGVINLRGVVLPIIDLADRLGFAPAEPTPRHVIIVTQTGRQVVGLLVDAVGEVLELPDAAREQNPINLDRKLAAVSAGVYRLDGRLLVVIRAMNVVPDAVWQPLRSAASA